MNLQTQYMGLELASPVVPSASPLSKDVSGIRQMEDCGAGAVVLYSVFEEQLQAEAQKLDHYLHVGDNQFAEALSYFPDVHEYSFGPSEYLEHITAAKAAVSMPVIASINCISSGGWTDYATQVEQAGADAIELNVYFIPTRPDVSADEVEAVYLEAVSAVKSAVDIPVAMKLSPFFSSTANMAAKLDEAGADALVLFNRFYQPSIDLDKLKVTRSIALSRSEDARLPLRWIALLSGHVEASLAGTTGVHTGRDAAKMILAGADVAMMASALLKNGIAHLQQVNQELAVYMAEKNFASIADMKGHLNQANCAQPAAFERANYMKLLQSFTPSMV